MAGSEATWRQRLLTKAALASNGKSGRRIRNSARRSSESMAIVAAGEVFGFFMLPLRLLPDGPFVSLFFYFFLVLEIGIAHSPPIYLLGAVFKNFMEWKKSKMVKLFFYRFLMNSTNFLVNSSIFFQKLDPPDPIEFRRFSEKMVVFLNPGW
jgi:hypothetical protein